MKSVVIALGGNAILKKEDNLDIATQTRNVRKALKNLYPIIKKNRVVITHGNGPSVGYLMMQNEMARSKVPVMPLDVLDAETEGQLGYLIQQNLQNIFRNHRFDKGIITVLTQVLVSRQDKAFRNPSKFVGPFYTKSQAQKLKRKFKIKEDIGRGFRRVVPSPKPVKIIEGKIINHLLRKGSIVIAAGGGGIPVIDKNGVLSGVEAVIDKDLASACLANSIKADTLIMVTDVDGVYLNYKKKNQSMLIKTRLRKITKYYKECQFPSGSMGPKVEAAIDFLSKGGRKVIISNVSSIEEAIEGRKGTTIIR